MPRAKPALPLSAVPNIIPVRRDEPLSVGDRVRWKLDGQIRINHLAKLTARAIYREAERCPDTKEAQEFSKWARVSDSRERRAAMVVCA
jgi:hypothetical protein